MAKKKQYTQFAVLGMGRFGTSIVETLSTYDVNIMACDKSEAKLDKVSDHATHLVQADLTDEHALVKLGLGNFDVVILAMGEDFEASLIAAMVAKESGAKQIIVKARDNRQKIVFESIGVNHVVLPEHEMGAKLARQLCGDNIMDLLEESSLYRITEIVPQENWVGRSIQESDIRRKHGLTVLAIRTGDKLHIPVLPDTVIHAEDRLIAMSQKEK